VQERLAKVEAYAESYLHDRVADTNLKIAETNLKEVQAFAEVVAALTDIPNACIRVGPLLVVKRTDPDGPLLVVRSLSVTETRTLEKYPEIQKDPSKVLDLLATALTMRDDQQALPPPDSPS
jgi:hypothetical protein